MSKDLLTVLTAHVLNDDFKQRMARTVERKTFCCIVYGGLLYDFSSFSELVRGVFEAGVSGIEPKAEGELLSVLLSRYLIANPTCSLFAHNFVSLDMPFPSIRSTDEAELRAFIGQCASMPLNLLIAEGDQIEHAGESVLAVADICDGDAWLLVAAS